MRNIKLLALDLDGTFFHKDTNVSQANLKALKRMHQQEIVIVPTSGRNIHDEFDFYKEIEIPYFIGSNGAVIKDRKSGEVIYKEYMDMHEANRFIKYLENNGLYVYVSCDDGILHSNMNITENLSNTYKDLFSKSFIEEPLSEYLREHFKNIEKVGTLVDTGEQVLMALKEKDTYHQIDIVQANTFSVEAYSKKTGKGTALKWLMDYLGIPKENVMAIGDSGSDVSMFKQAGLSVAMKNGTENARNTADYITLSNKEDGVAYVIDALLDGKELSDTRCISKK